MGMGGGANDPMERLCQPPSEPALYSIVNNKIQRRSAVRNLSEMRLTVRRIYHCRDEVFRVSPFQKKLLDCLT